MKENNFFGVIYCNVSLSNYEIALFQVCSKFMLIG